jgi:hypothetical protein
MKMAVASFALASLMATSSAFAQVQIQGSVVVPGTGSECETPPQQAYAQPVYTQPVYAQPAQPAYVAEPATPGYDAWGGGYGPGGQNPAFLVARVRGRLDQIGAELRAGVSAGRVDPRALRFFWFERRNIEGALSAAAADGVIAPPERQNLRAMIERAVTLGARFAVAYAPRPAYAGWGHRSRW